MHVGCLCPSLGWRPPGLNRERLLLTALLPKEQERCGECHSQWMLARPARELCEEDESYVNVSCRVRETFPDYIPTPQEVAWWKWYTLLSYRLRGPGRETLSRTYLNMCHLAHCFPHNRHSSNMDDNMNEKLLLKFHLWINKWTEKEQNTHKEDIIAWSF